MVGQRLGHQHLLWSQTGAGALDEHVQRIAGAPLLGQQAVVAGLPGRGLQRLQAQPHGRRPQGHARQPLGQQAAQVLHGLRRLGGAHPQRLHGRQRPAVEALAVQRPCQLQRQHPELARAQPVLQRREQARGGPQQRGGVVDPGVQIERLVEALGRRQPGVAFGRQSEGHVQRGTQLGPAAAHQPGARQRVRLAPGAAAQAHQQRQVRAGGAQHVQRQRLGQRRRRWQRLPGGAQTQHRQCY